MVVSRWCFFLFKNLELTVELFRRDLVRYLYSQTRRGILHRKKGENLRTLSVVFCFSNFKRWLDYGMHWNTKRVPLYSHCHTNIQDPWHFCMATALFLFFCMLMEGSGSVQIITSPESRGPKNIPTDPEHWSHMNKFLILHFLPATDTQAYW